METEVSIFIIIIIDVAIDGIGGRKRTLFFLIVPRPLPRVPTPPFFGLLEVLLMPSPFKKLVLEGGSWSGGPRVDVPGAEIGFLFI